MSASGRWADLAVRSASALVLLLVGGAAVWFGGFAFTLFVAVLSGAIAWEIFGMIAPEGSQDRLNFGILTAAAMTVAAISPPVTAPVFLLVPIGFALLRLRKLDANILLIASWALVGTYGLIWLRNEVGIIWALWLISIVVATDVAGYFVGKYFGGPKFWPRISPKKTWSGTAGGWIASVAVGLGFVWGADMSWSIVALSPVLSFASQLGDIVESALKRRSGVKDSSHLIPGHGGVFDRFDGMLGASALCYIAIVFGV